MPEIAANNFTRLEDETLQVWVGQEVTNGFTRKATSSRHVETAYFDFILTIVTRCPTL